MCFQAIDNRDWAAVTVAVTQLTHCVECAAATLRGDECVPRLDIDVK